MSKKGRPTGAGGVYRVTGRACRNGTPSQYSVAVPREIAERVPDDSRFRFHLTETGFAYELIVDEPEASWLKKEHAA